MNAPTLTYIESDFATATETVAEYRARITEPRRRHHLRRYPLRTLLFLQPR